MMASYAWSATTLNANSPLGINLTNIGTSDPELPLLNLFQGGAGWQTEAPGNSDTGEEACLNLDANGYPNSLVSTCAGTQVFTDVYVLLNRNVPVGTNGAYPAGQYVLLCDGQGTVNIHFDANLSVTCPSRTVFTVANPSPAGMSVSITGTDPGHTGAHVQNIRLLQLCNEAAFNGGQVFNPAFVTLLQKFRVLRFMDWLQTNNSRNSAWASRPTLTSAFYGQTFIGAPVELAVSLANQVQADAWLNVPHMADSNYITRMATLVHGLLGTTQKVYVEYSNETWNGTFGQSQYMTQQGIAQGWKATEPGTFQYNRDYYGMRVAQMCDTWKGVWGADASRVVCVMGAQAASDFTAAESLECPLWTGAPCAGHKIDAIAIAPYFGANDPVSFTTDGDGGLSRFFAALTTSNDPSVPQGGWIGQAIGWVQQYNNDAKFFPQPMLPIIAYEGGQGFASNGSSSALDTLYKAANSDPRMQQAYTTYLQQWQAAGGGIFVAFADIGPCSPFGCWGAIPTIMNVWNPSTGAVDQTVAGPKWTALQNFISASGGGSSCGK
jgi:hypothetical protein